MSTISRRTALTTGAALVTTGAATAPLAIKAAGVKAALAGEADDAILLAQIRRFHDLYRAQQDSWEKYRAHRVSVEAMPDCPQVLDHGAYDAFMEAHDAYSGWDQSNMLLEQTGALALTIFGTPARTARGALEKLKIARTAIGDGEGAATGDVDLEAFQDYDAPWLKAVIADLERLAGGAAS